MLVVPNSLSGTVDLISAAIYSGREIKRGDRLEASRFIASRQGLPGAYADTFAGFPHESKRIVAYTGEKFESASARHILGEECMRALRILDVNDKTVAQALERADRNLLERISRCDELKTERNNLGRFCCPKCSVAVWRNVGSGGLNKNDERLRAGMASLKKARDGKGRWAGFPFWYTVLTLNDIRTPEALMELEYAAPLLVRAAKKNDRGEEYAARRRGLAALALDGIGHAI